LIGFQAAQLVLNVEPCLPANIDEIFGLNVELARKRIDTDFVLQSGTPVQ
jgi:hypothetical protein